MLCLEIHIPLTLQIIDDIKWNPILSINRLNIQLKYAKIDKIFMRKYTHTSFPNLFVVKKYVNVHGI